MGAPAAIHRQQGGLTAAVFFIAASYLIGKILRVYDDAPGKRLILVKFCGLMGFSLAAIHAFMAVLLFSPQYYPKFFQDLFTKAFTEGITKLAPIKGHKKVVRIICI